MLTLFHDYTSPASAVAVARVERLVGDGLPVQIVGTEVVGLATSLPITVDLLAELAVVATQADAEGIVLRRPRLVPPTAGAHLVEDVARQHGRDTAWRRRCYRAYWDQGADISDHTLLRDLAADVDLPPAEVDRAVTDRVALLSIRQRFAAHRREGVGGVPTISFDRTLIPGLLSEDDLRALVALGPATA
ncbi:MAG: DsbA family protein [Actinobacteria bacterium]|nr:DsbA family protein [Actinomycetota bacterium]